MRLTQQRHQRYHFVDVVIVEDAKSRNDDNDDGDYDSEEAEGKVDE